MLQLQMSFLLIMLRHGSRGRLKLPMSCTNNMNINVILDLFLFQMVANTFNKDISDAVTLTWEMAVIGWISPASCQLSVRHIISLWYPSPLVIFRAIAVPSSIRWVSSTSSWETINLSYMLEFFFYELTRVLKGKYLLQLMVVSVFRFLHSY